MSVTFLDDEDEQLYDALKAKGHSPALTDDYENDDGSLTFDMFYLSVDIHNGPGCSVCHYSLCHHCWNGDPNSIEECTSPIICVEVTRGFIAS